MGDIVNLEKFKEKKEEQEEVLTNDDLTEYPEEDFQEMLDYEIDLNFDNYMIFNDEFIEQNAEHIAHHTIPYCTVCETPLQKGDRVDSMWPLEYGHNVCKQCENKLPKKIKKEKIINLDKIELIIRDKDFQKIIKHLEKHKIYNIKGHNIITEELYQKIKYKILNENNEDFLKLP